MSRKPPLECAMCGMPRWNDSTVMWLGPTWEDRQPYCVGECVDYITRNGPISLGDIDRVRVQRRTLGTQPNG